ncbi:acetylglutamate kinase [Neptunicella marina]|uniref:Acetylglutamate kinase n=1 Tax=Neptunicella marina TaxID=2125989 RepID=A0A8J6IYI5_9ALTE|nr:acetylglutamate kinase [Neptunicella marina]MBC3767625.1 acetylglutamate kinase [Neptunicella marina]
MSSLSPIVIKVGGALLESPAHMQKLFEVAATIAAERSLVFVHGGGSLVENWLQALGKTSQKHNGLRVTPADQIEFVAGALAGAANKKLVAQAKMQQLNAVGLSLADGDMVSCTVMSAELGLVGQASPAQGKVLLALMQQGFVPVISSIGCDETGELLNVNADQAAEAVAQSIGAELLLLSDVPGVLDAGKNLISSLNAKQIDNLIEQGIIRDGMAVKVKSALQTATQIGKPVIIAGWKNPEYLADLTQEQAVGTTIYPQS